MEQGVYSYGLLEDSTVFVLCQALRRDERHVHNLSLRNQFADQVEPLVLFPVVLFRHLEFAIVELHFTKVDYTVGLFDNKVCRSSVCRREAAMKRKRYATH